MKIKKITVFILFAVIGLSLISIMRLNQNPVSFFVLKNGSNVVKVYQVDVYFWGESASFKEVSLSPRQILEAEKIIGDKSLIELKQWSKSFGEFNFVVGLFDENNDLVFDWSRFFNSKTDNTISDLDQWDKAYLSLMTRTMSINSKPYNEMIKTETREAVSIVTPTALVSGKTTLPEPIVRVEILNGCGIKGAAEWMVERIKGPQITAENGGNADKFTYINSVVRSRVKIPSSFDQALKRLGFSSLTVNQSGVVPTGYDVVLIVGKDFEKLKGK